MLFNPEEAHAKQVVNIINFICVIIVLPSIIIFLFLKFCFQRISGEFSSDLSMGEKIRTFTFFKSYYLKRSSNFKKYPFLNCNTS